LLNESMKDFLDYSGIRKYKSNQGYLAKWIAQKIQWSNKKEVLGISKVWAHSLRIGKYTKEKLEELNRTMDNEILVALNIKTLNLEDEYVFQLEAYVNT